METATKIDLNDFKKLLKPIFEFVNRENDKWKLTIYSEPDGYILEGNIDCIKRKWPAKDIYELLWQVVEFFAEAGSKHDEQRINISWKKRND